MEKIMAILASMSIRAQLFLIALIVAIPAAGIIVFSGVHERNDAVLRAEMETQRLTTNIASEQQHLITAAQQLIVALTQLPEVKKPDRARVEPILRDILRLNSQYSNIFIADRKGMVWASAVPTKPPFIISDRRYFKNALSSGQFSSGEFIVSRATARPVFNMAYPIKNRRGEIVGAICVGFDLAAFKNVLDRARLPAGVGFIMLDHEGIVVYRSLNPEQYVGKSYNPVIFQSIREGPDQKTLLGITSIDVDYRIATFHKLQLPSEQEPYMYIGTGMPLAIVIANSNKALIWNLSLFSACLCLAILLAWFIGKRSIADRIALLEKATHNLSEGNLQIRISELVSGGELGRLAQTFDDMAHKLEIEDKRRRVSEEKYIALFEEAKDAVFVATPQGRYLDINPAGVELYGYSSRAEMLELDINRDIYLDPAERRAYIQAMEEKGFVRDYELRLKRKDGKILFIMQSAIAVNDDQGNVIEYRGIDRDITERKQAEEEKEKLLAQLLQAQKMEAVGQLAGGVAHDFNNILAVIMNAGYLLEMQLNECGTETKYLSEIVQAADKAAGLTQGLLAFSRKQHNNPRPVDLNTVIKQAENILTMTIGEAIQLNLQLTEQDTTVLADSNQIVHILINLATNARDAMPQGGDLTIATSHVFIDEGFIKLHGYGSIGDYIVMTFSDTGIGMGEETRNRIFEPFFTTKELGRGTGLGLSITYGIVKQNNGIIDVYSEKGRGTVFNIYLSATEMKAEHPEPAERLQPGPGTETILAVEDDNMLRQALSEMLQTVGYAVIEACDGDDAVAKFLAHKDEIDLVIMDIIMPRKSGGEAYKELKAIKPDLKIILTSGYTGDYLSDKLSMGEDMHFIEKPVTPQKLFKKIRAVLGNSPT